MDMADDGKKIETFQLFNIFGKMGVNEWKYDLRFHILWPIGSVYGIFTYIYHNQVYTCRRIYHTWIVWVWCSSMFLICPLKGRVTTVSFLEGQLIKLSQINDEEFFHQFLQLMLQKSQTTTWHV